MAPSDDGRLRRLAYSCLPSVTRVDSTNVDGFVFSFSFTLGQASDACRAIAARAIGSEELEKKFNDSLKCLERQSSVAFAASLYLVRNLSCLLCSESRVNVLIPAVITVLLSVCDYSITVQPTLFHS